MTEYNCLKTSDLGEFEGFKEFSVVEVELKFTSFMKTKFAIGDGDSEEDDEDDDELVEEIEVDKIIEFVWLDAFLASKIWSLIFSEIKLKNPSAVEEIKEEANRSKISIFRS